MEEFMEEPVEVQNSSSPKITAKISISMSSVTESLKAPVTESITPIASPFPQSSLSPRPIDVALGHTPSPRLDSSPRDFDSPRKAGSRLVGFFEKIGSKGFLKKKPSGYSPRSPKSSDTESPRSNAYSKAESPQSLHEKQEAHLMKSSSCSINTAKRSSYTIQKQKSFVSKGDMTTEIQFSPRQQSQSPVLHKSSEEGTSILVYCGNEIIAWCDKQFLKYQYNNLNGVFKINLTNAEIIQIQSEKICASSLDKNTIYLFIDLIKTLPHVENVLIYYVLKKVLRLMTI